MNLTELKARAYDLIALIEQAQGELRQVNEAIRNALIEQNKTDNEKTIDPDSVK
jgi:hypothetical protein